MTYAIWAAIVGWVGRTLAKVFTPHGNLLTSDLIAEVTVHVLSNGQRKTYANKIDSVQTADAAIQGMLLGTIEMAKQFQIGINWRALEGVYPYRGPGGPPPK